MARKRFEDEVEQMMQEGYDRRTAEAIARLAVAGHGDVIAYDEKGRMIDAIPHDDLGWSDPATQLPGEHDGDPTQSPPDRR